MYEVLANKWKKTKKERHTTPFSSAAAASPLHRMRRRPPSVHSTYIHCSKLAFHLHPALPVTYPSSSSLLRQQNSFRPWICLLRCAMRRDMTTTLRLDLRPW